MARVELNLEYFGFLHDSSMTNVRFAALFDGPQRQSEGRITRREIDLARSIQEVTEEASFAWRARAKELTGEKYLCLAGGVALNCVANGRILREGPLRRHLDSAGRGRFRLCPGVALDAYHTYYGRERSFTPGQSTQGGSYFGPEFLR